MSVEVDPKRCGKCWSCKHCSDLGTYRYEDHVSYMRKCTKSGHEYVDSCQSYCSDYEWDGHTTDYSGSSSSSSSYSSSSSTSTTDDSSGCGKGCLIAIIVIAILAAIAFFVPNIFSASENEVTKEPVQYEAQYEESLNISAKVNTKSDSLNLRGGPSTKYDTVGTLPKGAQVTIHHKEGNWAYVEYDGVFGWCSGNYLKEQK